MEKNALLQRALTFQKNWLPLVEQGHVTERQHDREFMADFYEVFGISRSVSRVGYEWRVKIDGHNKRIDSLLPKLLIIEMESQGVKIINNPNAGYEQAARYAYALNDANKPKYILACDFEHFYLRDPATKDVWTTTLQDFVKDIDEFSFLLGYEQKLQEDKAVVNAKAAGKISTIYRHILDVGVQPNAASLLMTRIVFCLFADDTSIFERNGVFQELLENTAEDGSDLLSKLTVLFRQLNTSDHDWIGQKREFGYINGGLFALDIAKFTTDLGLTFNANVRQSLIDASHQDWSVISPVIFGSMFEGALDPEKRHDLGAHFTSEKNILKVIDSLFMNGLRDEFENARHTAYAGGARTKALNRLHSKILGLKFLDPACGSGNFLIVAYRELRRLEHEILDVIMKDEYQRGVQMPYDFVSTNIKVEVNQFYGIEIQPYAVSIARVGMWLMDHLMNVEASELFGELVRRIPLHAGANIIQADALKVDWLEVFNQSDTLHRLELDDVDYILGNPPFIGQTLMSKSQKQELKDAVPYVNKIGKVDFVAGWYFKTADLMIRNNAIKAALVSTNSIAQGEQSIIVGQHLFKMGVHYDFAHQTFKWDNNGASVFAVIIGFSISQAQTQNELFRYNDIAADPVGTVVPTINEYLLPTPPVNIQPTNLSISGLPHMSFGTMPRDGGNLILNQDEKDELLSRYPIVAHYVRPFIGAKEFLHDDPRYILYLKGAPTSVLKVKPVYERINAVQQFRAASKASSTASWASKPTELVQDQAVDTDVLLLPRVSSGRREYIPVGFKKFPTIGSDQVFQVENATLSLFALLQSKMHMTWMQTVGGRLKGDYRYSNTLVYNTFAVPILTKQQHAYLSKYAELILDARRTNLSNGASLADLYDPLLMPSDLRKAHQRNDKFVDSIYGLDDPTEEQRLVTLVKCYQDALSRLNR
ncbi:DNA methyltransferase [Lacticaseibacillus paracasei]|uniref:DNA methyltransferase n=1 Tax=Lacticaseibacillus paracasei TaxID=1597 RepID=UPI0031DC18E8